MSKRFSKAKLLEELRSMADRRSKQFGFNPRKGWIQVDGMGEHVNREYGEWLMMSNLIDWISSGDIGIERAEEE